MAVYIIFIVLLNVLLLGRTINFKPTVDDERRDRYKVGQFTPIITFWKMIRSSGDCHPKSLRLEHLLSIVLHTITCILIYIFFGSTHLSFLVAILFCVHPVNTQVSTWMNGKRYAVSAIIVLIMLKFVPYGIILYPLLTFFQISGLMSPIFYMIEGHWWAVFFMFMLFGLSRGHILRQISNRYHKQAPVGELRSTRAGKIIIAIKTFGFYTSHILFPTKVAFIHEFLDTFGNTEQDNKYWYKLDWRFYRGLLFVGILGVTMYLQWGNAIGRGVFWYFLFIAQWLNYPITITQSVTDRYCYLPMIGLLIAVTNGLIATGNVWVAYMWVGYLLAKNFYAVNSYNGIDETLRNNLFVYPDHIRARAALAERYIKKHIFHAAYYECQLGLEVRRTDFRLNTLAAKCLIFMDKEKYKEPIAHLIKTAKGNFNLGTEKNCKKHIQILEDMSVNWKGFDYEQEGKEE